MPITNGQNADAGDFINESERNATPANDAGKVPKLENDGLLHRTFCRLPITREYQVADSPATWTKPSGLVRVLVQAWGGGGSGASRTSLGPTSAGGGSGASYAEAWLDADLLGSTETVTIGAGGAAVSGDSDGNNGNDTTFGSLLTAYRGLAGLQGGALVDGADIGNGNSAFKGTSGKPNGSFWGGGSGSGNASGVGGDAHDGGAGGGAADAAENRAGGTSLRGGDGGDGNRTGNGQDGAERGGGGGGSFTGNSGKGGDGFVRVIEFY